MQRLLPDKWDLILLILKYQKKKKKEKKKTNSYKIKDPGSSIKDWGNWTQTIDITKLFEKNNQTLTQKPSFDSKFEAYVLYLKCFWKSDGSDGLGRLIWIWRQLRPKWHCSFTKPQLIRLKNQCSLYKKIYSAYFITNSFHER